MENMCCVTLLPSSIFKLFLVFILILIEFGQAEHFEKLMSQLHLSVTNPALLDGSAFAGVTNGSMTIPPKLSSPI